MSPFLTDVIAGPKKVVDWLERDLATWKVLVLLSAGAFCGFLVLFVDFHWWDDRHRDFAGMSPFVLWAGLMCAQTALWALALAWLVPSVRLLWPHEEEGEKTRTERVGRRSEPVLSSAAIALVIVPFVVGSSLVSTRPDYMPGHSWKVGLLTFVGVAVGLVAAWGVWLVHGRLKQLETRKYVGTEDSLNTFLGLQSDLHRFLGALGAILGLLVLSTGAHRRMVLAYHTYRPHTTLAVDYGYELVLVYGFFFSILVAAVYLPTHLTRARVGGRIRDAFFPVLTPASAEWQDRAAKREQLGGVLELQVGPLSQFKASAAILAPLISSLVGLLLK